MILGEVEPHVSQDGHGEVLARIPIVYDDGRTGWVIFRAKPFGDPHSIMIAFPPELNGRLILPAEFFSQKIIPK